MAKNKTIYNGGEENMEPQKKYCGLDLGTGNICSAVMNSDKTTEIGSMRNMFISVENDTDFSNIDHIVSDGKSFIFGHHAMVLANIFARECRRPMKNGVISTSDIDAGDVMGLMIENLIGKGNGNTCVYSIPSPPIDNADMNVLYHTKVFERILKQLGWNPVPLPQALAVCYSECEKDNFTALIADFGAGMTNCGLVYRKTPAVQFSTTKGGDYIDRSAANSLGITAVGRITAIKEKELNLNNPMVGSKKEQRIREAITYFYKDLVEYTLKQVSQKFINDCSDLELPNEIPLIISGGTSKAEGFLEFIRDIIQDIQEDFPIKISEIRAAGDPLTAVATGCLIYALSKSVE